MVKKILYVVGLGLGLAFWLGWMLKPVQYPAAPAITSLQPGQTDSPSHPSVNAQLTAVEPTLTGGVTARDEPTESAVRQSEDPLTHLDLSEFADNMAQGGEQSRQHLQRQQEFDKQWDESNLDLGMVNQIQDYLYLHQDAELIQLHDIRCESNRCQLTGEMASEHQQWNSLVKEMQSTEWWTFTGTSNSSTTKDGKTYFVLFLSRD